MYGRGISREGELLDLAVKLDIVQKGGSWFSYGETRLGQGRDNVKEFLLGNQDIYSKIEEEVKANVGKLYSKSAKNRVKSDAKVVAKPVEINQQPEGTEISAARIVSNANIDITVDD